MAPCPRRILIYATTSGAVPEFATEARRALKRKKARLRGPFLNVSCLAAAVMPAMVVAARTVAIERLQLEAGDTGGDIQPGLALHAKRLQRVGVGRTADQEVAAETYANRSIGADAAVRTGEFAGRQRGVRCAHRPGELGLLGEAEIDADPANDVLIVIGAIPGPTGGIVYVREDI